MSRDNRASQQAQPEVQESSPLPSLRVILGALVVGALVVFMLQNLQETEIHFLWFDWTTRLLYALLASAVFGSLATWLFSAIRGWSQRRRDREIFEAGRR